MTLDEFVRGVGFGAIGAASVFLARWVFVRLDAAHRHRVVRRRQERWAARNRPGWPSPPGDWPPPPPPGDAA